MFQLNKKLRCEINLDMIITQVGKHKVEMPKREAYEKLYNGDKTNKKLDTDAISKILVNLKNTNDKVYVNDEKQIQR
jgi:hypothetical protein